MKRARKVKFTKALADEIVAAIAVNDCGIGSLLKKEKYKHLPYKTTIFRWWVKYPNFGAACKRAMSLRCMPLSEKLLETALDTFNQRESKEQIARDRLIVDTLKWKLEKLMRHEYGNSQDLEVARLTQELNEIKELVRNLK